MTTDTSKQCKTTSASALKYYFSGVKSKLNSEGEMSNSGFIAIKDIILLLLVSDRIN